MSKKESLHSVTAPVSRHELTTAIRIAGTTLSDSDFVRLPKNIARLLLQMNYFAVGQEVGAA